MKTLEIEDEVYQYIASKTEHIGENASSILRRLLAITPRLETNKWVLTLPQASMPCNEALDFSTIQKLIASRDFKQEKKNILRFLSILSHLYHWDHARFSLAATSLHGSKRQYLATSESALREHGRNTKPKLIANTPYWVVTNNNTARKSHIIATLMRKMTFPEPVIKEVILHFTTKMRHNNDQNTYTSRDKSKQIGFD